MAVFDTDVKATKALPVQSQQPVLRDNVVWQVAESRVIEEPTGEAKGDVVFPFARLRVLHPCPSDGDSFDNFTKILIGEGIELGVEPSAFIAESHARIPCRCSKTASASLSAAVRHQFRIVPGLRMWTRSRAQ